MNTTKLSQELASKIQQSIRWLQNAGRKL